MPKATSKEKEKTTFYPEQETAFCDKSSTQKLLIVESQENLAVINDLEDGFVAVYSLESGHEDFANWLQSVKDGKIEVVWCPVMKRVENNKDYLKHWKLS